MNRLTWPSARRVLKDRVFEVFARHTRFGRRLTRWILEDAEKLMKERIKALIDLAMSQYASDQDKVPNA